MIEKTLISVNSLLEDTASDGTDGSLNIEGGCVSRPSDEPMEKKRKIMTGSYPMSSKYERRNETHTSRSKKY